MVTKYIDESKSGPASKAQLDQVLGEVIRRINEEYGGQALQAPGADLRQEIETRITHLVPEAAKQFDLRLKRNTQMELAAEAARRVLGLGFLDELLPPARTDLSEITVYSQTGHAAVMQKGSVRWKDLDTVVDPAEVRRVIARLLEASNKQLSEATPIVGARLPATPENPGGGRINAIHHSLAGGEGPSLNIRLYEQKPVDPQWLVRQGAMSPAMMDLLGDFMRDGKRILILGGTRTGKTTMLSAILNYLPEGYRIVLIEDPSEIWIPRQQVQQLEARHVPPGVELEDVTLAQLVDTAMRMSPDYLVVGEVRDGQAANALFRAITTGHAGACTFHAESPRHAFSRLQTILQADQGVPAQPAARMIADGVDIVVQISIVKEVRRVTTIAAVRDELNGGNVWFDPLYKFDWDSPAGAPGWEQVGELADRQILRRREHAQEEDSGEGGRNSG